MEAFHRTQCRRDNVFDAAAAISALGVPVRGVSDDSRDLPPDAAFLAYPGATDDGRRYIETVIRAGACAVFWEAEGFEESSDWRVPHRAINGLREKAGLLADAVYHHPSEQLNVLAVTGTNGKTTISHFIARLLEAGGIPAGVIGTLGIGTPDALIPSGTTTPPATKTHRYLRNFVDAGLQAAVIEASSHGIRQGRLNGIRLSTAVFSNVGRDHLDYHGSIEHYRASKAALLQMPHLQTAVLNADDAFCAELAASAASSLQVMTYGKRGKTLRLLAMHADSDGVSFTTDGIGGLYEYRLNVPGEHNVYNFLAAVLTVTLAGVDGKTIAAAAPTLRLPSGRMQLVADRPAVYIDFAHTPDAFAAVLAAVAHRRGKLLVVFGCGGGRDRGKRPQMGALVAEVADRVFITDDNPRQEDAATIRAEIAAAAPAAVNIGDRQEAICAALAEATADDTVLILGKGHEDYQEISGSRLPFSDAIVVREFLATTKYRVD